MGNNKVSEKAVWEGSISPDNDTPSIGSQMQAQPQMMFCYKCNNVIPSDSTFCPYCQIKLYTECPKCGASYSSQYPACSKCGTNREEYLQMQRREAERKASIERENKRRQEIEERKRLEEERKRKEAEEEKERQERLKRHEQQANERQQKDAYLKENAEIKETEEYKMTYSILNEALKALDDKKKKKKKKTLLLFVIPYIYLALDYCFIDLANGNFELFITIFIILFVISLIALIVSNVHDNDREWQEEYLMQYASSKCRNRENLLSTHLISMVWAQGEGGLSDCCIIAYREKHNLTINYKWHNLIKY